MKPFGDEQKDIRVQYGIKKIQNPAPVVVREVNDFDKDSQEFLFERKTLRQMRGHLLKDIRALARPRKKE
jgi:hypothetical protein